MDRLNSRCGMFLYYVEDNFNCIEEVLWAYRCNCRWCKQLFEVNVPSNLLKAQLELLQKSNLSKKKKIWERLFYSRRKKKRNSQFALACKDWASLENILNYFMICSISDIEDKFYFLDCADHVEWKSNWGEESLGNILRWKAQQHTRRNLWFFNLILIFLWARGSHWR